MAQLNGYAIKISWLGADHTYVTSSGGGVWPCWGRSSGGRLICSGNGSSNQANCISQTDSHAGIIYGVTGVCHQTANRILYPARVIVSRASGYWASVAFYGTYGTPSGAALAEWEARKARCAGLSEGMRPSVRAAAAIATPEDKDLRDYLDKVDATYARRTEAMTLSALRGDEDISSLGEEFELMADYRLGTKENVGNIASLRKIQDDVLQEKRNYDRALISKTLTAEQYARKVNALVARFMKNSARVLGTDAHTRLFGVAPRVSFQIVDAKILAKHH